MEADEIREILDQARRLCADAEAIRDRGDGVNAVLIARFIASIARVSEVTESLLAEREAFTGRLRRTRAATPPANDQLPSRGAGGSFPTPPSIPPSPEPGAQP